MRPTPILLAIGFNIPNTGLTRVMHNILNPLSGKYDIHFIGIGHKGEPYYENGIHYYPCNLKGGDVWGVFQSKAFVEAYKPDLVFLLNDYWMLTSYMLQAESFTSHSKLVAYCPLDGRILDPASIKHLEHLDRLVLYTTFAQREFVTATTKIADANFTLPQIDIIPHGVNTEKFFPLLGSVEQQLSGDGRLQAKRAVFSAHRDWQQGFVVLNANQAQPRKRIDLTIEGFAHFAQGKPDNVKLCLHHAILKEAGHSDLVDLARRFNISERLQLTAVKEPSKQGLSDDDLNLLYNACDVGLNTSIGEGWGLISFEHGATGAAQIVPNHSACTDLWQDSATLMNPIESVSPQGLPLEMKVVSTEEVALALENLYSNSERLKQQSLAAYDLATQTTYCWREIAVEWDQLFQSVISE